MSRHQRIIDILTQHVSLELFEVENESHQHHVSPGAESHFRIVLVSNAFKSLNRLARHRQINHLLEQEFSSGLHALTLFLYTPEEWENKKQKPAPSPTCKGGMHHELTLSKEKPE
jgi:BolA protein